MPLHSAHDQEAKVTASLFNTQMLGRPWFETKHIAADKEAIHTMILQSALCVCQVTFIL